MNSLNNLQSLGFYVPELILVLSCAFTIICSLNKRTKPYYFHVAFGGLLLSLFYLFLFNSLELYNVSLFLDLIVYDQVSYIAKIIFLLSTLFIFINSIYDNGIADERKAEFYSLVIIIVVGLFAMSSSVNLLMVYLAIEIVSIPSYLITGFVTGKESRESNEASLKYVLYGAFASALMVFGMTWLYGLTGSLYFNDISSYLLFNYDSSLAFTISILLIMVGFGYKISVVPFHYWAPDVYQGAPLSVTAFLSIAPKVAGIILILRFFYSILIGFEGLAYFPLISDWTFLFAVISAITMTFGNVIAIQQDNVRRMLAYSSISHMGFVLIGMCVVDTDAILHILFYLIMYMFMTLGAFFIVQFVESFLKRKNITEWSGLAYKYPVLSAMMVINLIALAGLPPSSGFVIKFYLLASLIQSKSYFWLAIVAVINSVISLYYYFKLVKAMYLDGEEEEIKIVKVPNILNYLIIILSIQGLLFYLYWSPLYSYLSGIFK